jgi:Predicted molecular chaperone distantly related to HSP70-fold metalloproteases
MLCKVIGIMSGSSLDGLDIIFCELTEVQNKWNYKIIAADCYEYEPAWANKLKIAETLSARDYLVLDAEYGKYIGQKINYFIRQKNIQQQVQLIASHGHTVFHLPHQNTTAQLGNGAAIAVTTGIDVVNDLRANDVALGGQGAPIVPMGEMLLWNEFDYLLNIGGIANISIKNTNNYTAFDVCAANRVLNMLANELHQKYDKGGQLAASGNIYAPLLNELNNLNYYRQPAPKSLANSFGIQTVYPLIKSFTPSIEDALRTYVEHVAYQIQQSIINNSKCIPQNARLLITGGGAHNHFLTERIKHYLSGNEIEAVIPEKEVIDYKEALIMALLGVLRLQGQDTVLASVTGAMRNSVGGAWWSGK